MDHPIDGSLRAWGEVAGECEWSSLLLGNGLSRNVSSDFAYPSLYDEARRGTSTESLTTVDRELFSVLGTRNFEHVLSELAAAIRMTEALGRDSKPYLDRY
jgi:hypothetical protein